MHSKTLEAKAARKAALKLPQALTFLRNFEHWDVVGQCAVPFLIISALLGGAIFVKNKLGASSSAEGVVPAVQVDPGAWQKMTDLTKAEEALQAAVKMLNQDNAMLDYEEKARKRLDSADQFQRATADRRVQQAQMAVNTAGKQFNAAESKYRQLGGTKDYRSELKRF
jgi:cell division protein FtsB